MKSSAECIEERRQRIAEYEKMRACLLAVVDDDKAPYADKVGAINAIYRIDKDGVPMPKNWK